MSLKVFEFTQNMKVSRGGAYDILSILSCHVECVVLMSRVEK